MYRLYLRIFLSFFAISGLFVLLFAKSGYALDPDEVVVVANGNVAQSIKLAEFYMAKRAISSKNIIVLNTSAKETCSRRAFEKQIQMPIRRYLKSYTPQRRIRCLVLIYGLPLRVNPPLPNATTKKQAEALEQDLKYLKKLLHKIGDSAPNRKKALEKKLAELKNEQKMLSRANALSSVDSELMLVMAEGYPTAGWVANPYFAGAMNAKPVIPKDDVLMVSRLDGPSAEIVRRIIKDTLEAEKKSLSGKAYFDARWPKSVDVKEKQSGYIFYDRAIHRAASVVEKSGRMPVVLEYTDRLFQPGQAPNAALYCGWYSLAKYENAFTWEIGAVGYHIASSECTTLKKRGSQVWCKRMLEEGVAATIGPVGEPYVSGFPPPDMFFGSLVDGYLTLAECYLISLPHLSWKMVLIGDPLYRPFKNLD